MSTKKIILYAIAGYVGYKYVWPMISGMLFPQQAGSPVPGDALSQATGGAISPTVGATPPPVMAPPLMLPPAMSLPQKTVSLPISSRLPPKVHSVLAKMVTRISV